MPDRRRADRRILAAALALALAVPLIGSRVLAARLRGRVEPTLSAALGESVSIGGVEATLTGTVRLRDVRVGGLFAADAIEASIGLDSLIGGRFSADEIAIEAPRLRTRVDRTGEQKIRRLLQRAAAARRRAHPGTSGGASRLRRIVVSGGELRVDLEGRGILRAHQVELHPRAGGVRLVTGPIDIDLIDDGLFTRGRFERVGADVAVPKLSVERVLGVDGTITFTGPRIGADGVTFTDAIATVGIDAPDRLRLLAAVAGDDPTAQVELTADLSGDALAVDIRGAGVPLAPLAPFAPRWLELRDGRATGTARLQRDGAHIAADLDLDARGIVIDHHRVSTEPIALAGHATGRARIDPAETGGTVRLDELAITSEGVTLQATAAIVGPIAEDGVPSRLELRLQLPTTPCASVLHAIPPPARRRLAGLTTRGDLGGSLELAFDRADPESTHLDVDLDVGCVVASEATDADPAALRKPFRHTFPNGSTGVVGAGQPGYARYSEIPALVARSFVAAEDARFFDHRGFDPAQIEASLAVDLSERELVRGGSTITQQLAKNVFLDPQRTFSRKLEEAIIAWRLEERLGKKAILETYLNIIELGDGVFGVRDAARYWFAKELRRLTPREVAFLAALTPAPQTISRRVRTAGKIDPETNERIDVILRHMRNAGAITPAQYSRARSATVVVRAPLLSLNAEE